MVAKTWRWQFLFYLDKEVPAFTTLWQALAIGQLLNLLAPIRIGEVARVYVLYQHTQLSKAQALGTLIVEKALDMILLALSLLILLPVVVVPHFFTSNQRWLFVLLSLAILFALYLLAYQAEWIHSQTERISQWLPVFAQERLQKWLLSGLQGLAALRSGPAVGLLLISSLLILSLSVMTPLLIFRAFQLPYGLIEAIWVNFVVTIGTVPASSPAKVGVFEWLVIFTLMQFGLSDEAINLSYALVYHLVAILPLIVIGSIAGANTSWSRPLLQ
jgi:glycosyltransferase 2 family protein